MNRREAPSRLVLDSQMKQQNAQVKKINLYLEKREFLKNSNSKAFMERRNINNEYMSNSRGMVNKSNISVRSSADSTRQP